MYLPVILCIAAVVLLMLFMSLRISVELTAEESGISYTIRGNIFRYIKKMEIRSGSGRKRVNKKKGEKRHDKLLGIIKTAIRKNNGKVIHVEKLSLTGTFSIEDAAANAILYGIFLILWQYIILFLSANFTFEHHNYNLRPDFQNNKNSLFFQIVMRIVVLKALLLLIKHYLETKIKNRTE